MNDEPIGVLIADDHPFFRDGIRVLLEAQADMHVVGESGTGEQTIQVADAVQPDIIIMDIKMPGMNGIEATRQIHAQSPHIRILIMTMFDDDDTVFAALRAGAHGYILKGADQEELLRAIRALHNGEAIFGSTIAQRLLTFFATPRPVMAQIFPQLSEREREILDLMARGRNNQEIARDLVVSPKTVRNHVSNIFNKLQVADRTQAILQAREAGLGQ